MVPFGVVVLVLFAFALGPDRAPMAQRRPGTVLGGRAVLHRARRAAQRRRSRRPTAPATACGCRGSTPPACSWARPRPSAPQLVVLEVVLGAGVVLLYGAHVDAPLADRGVRVLGTVGLAAAGTLYGALSAGLRVRETLLPFLLLPVAAPVLLAGTRIWQAAMAGGHPGRRRAVAPPPGGLRRRLPGPRRRHLRPAAGGGVSPAGPGASPPVGVAARSAVGRARRVERAIGLAAVVALAGTVWLGLWVTPPDQTQGDLVRLVYLHPAWPGWRSTWPSGWPPVSSLLWLWPRTRSLFWDRLAAAAVEVGVVFNVCTLVSGSIWGRPTWGVWWAWDARLTSTAVLLVLFLGYLALRRVPAEPEVRAKRSAFVALFAAVDVPIVHFSVLWWQTLHQGATVLNPDLSPDHPRVDGVDAVARLRGLTLVFVWMLLVRYRIGVLRGPAGPRRARRGAAPSGGPKGSGDRRGRGGLMRYVVAGYVVVLGILLPLRRARCCGAVAG